MADGLARAKWLLLYWTWEVCDIRRERALCLVPTAMPSLCSSILTLTLFILSLASVCAAGDGKVLAVFGDAAAATVLPPGWTFLWNATGEMGNSKGYAPLAYEAKTKRDGVLDDRGTTSVDQPGCTQTFDVSARRDSSGVARYFIATFTLAEDSAGEVWIHNGNLRNKSFTGGNTLELYVNDELKSKTLIPMDRFSRTFQKNLGRLRRGDAIRVAVGPGDKSRQGGGKFYFTIEDHAVGKSPAAPVNFVSPAIDSVVPQSGPDGNILPSFATKHQGQCAAAQSLKPELVFIGDSITTRWPQEVLKQRFGKFRPVNLGVGGDWIQNVHWRIRHGALDGAQPKVIVLLIETNNITAGFTPDEITQGIRLLLAAIHDKAPQSKILLEGILPRGPSIQEATNETIRLINSKLSTLADGKKVFYLDVGGRLVEPDGSISPQIMPDKLHLAGPGYTRWLEALRPVLDRLLNE